MGQQTTYDEVIEKDIELTWAVQHYVHSNPSIRDWCKRLISKYPLQDVCSLIWVFAVVGWIEMGMKHFWVVVVNLFAAFILRKLLEVRRPVEFDIRLQPMTDQNVESYSVPSIESYMSVVIFGHFVIHYNSFLFLILGAGITFIIGFSRVYSKARFAHHIVMSWVLGLVGLNLAHRYCEHINVDQLRHSMHGFWGVLAATAVMCNFALAMENNDSRLLGVPKKDFVDVLQNIMNGGSERDDERVEDPDAGTTSSEGDLGVSYGGGGDRDRPPTPRGARPVDTPRAAAARRAARLRADEGVKRTMGVTRRDSFYFLQKTLMRRAEARGVPGSRNDFLDGGGSIGSPRGTRGTPGSTPRGYYAT